MVLGTVVASKAVVEAKVVKMAAKAVVEARELARFPARSA